MIETFAALLFAHALADFLLQTGWMVAHKRRPGVILLHTAIVLLTAQATTGQVAALPLILLAALHLAIDLAKTFLSASGLRAFLIDQGAHLASIAAIAGVFPGLWETGLWGGVSALPALMLLAAGAILVTRAGGFAVGLLVAPWGSEGLPEGLPRAGAIIGTLERAIIYVLVLAGEPTAIGFLIAAKSILRFDAAKENRTAEYVIVGTLASFAWGLGVAYAVRVALPALPPLELPI